MLERLLNREVEQVKGPTPSGGKSRLEPGAVTAFFGQRTPQGFPADGRPVAAEHAVARSGLLFTARHLAQIVRSAGDCHPPGVSLSLSGIPAGAASGPTVRGRADNDGSGVSPTARSVT